MLRSVLRGCVNISLVDEDSYSTWGQEGVGVREGWSQERVGVRGIA